MLRGSRWGGSCTVACRIEFRCNHSCLSIFPKPPDIAPPNLLVLAKSHFDIYNLITSITPSMNTLPGNPHSNITAIHLLSSPREALSSLHAATPINPYLAVPQYQLSTLLLPSVTWA